MIVKITFSPSSKTTSGAAVFFTASKKTLPDAAKALDKKAGGLITQALKSNKGFEAKHGQKITLSLPSKAGFETAIIIGTGEEKKFDTLAAENLGGKLYGLLTGEKIDKAVFHWESSPDQAASLAMGLELASYRFEKYKSDQKDKKTTLSVSISVKKQAEAAKSYKRMQADVAGIFLARDLVNEPSNKLTPDAYAKRITKELKPLGVQIDILDQKKLKTLGFEALLAVGQGSDQPSRVVIMRWNGKPGTKTKKADAPIALVGKGVTFDTGGYSLKPPAGMEEMVMDMGGSAAVVGAMKALALSKAKENVVGIVGLVENMISGGAYKPGDIIGSLSGKTIEVYNTDAEGRLVLADCLTYAQQKYKPRRIIDLATLTGAMMVALGYEYAGAFSTDDKLWADLEKAGKETADKIWRMPLDDAYKKAMDGTNADLNNMGNAGRMAGGCTAAGFLSNFIESDVPWAHIDIAGTAWSKAAKPTQPKGATGYGVRLLSRLISG